MKVDESKLRQYLLKNLSDKETETIDLQFFDDDEIESALQIAEENLIEDFIDKTLSPAEYELFQQNFLVTKQRREHLAFMTELKAQVGKIPIAESEKPLTFLEKLAKLFRPKFPQIVVFASAAIIFAVFAWWLIGSNGQTTEIATLNQQDLSNLSPYQKTSNLSLDTDVYRGKDDGKSLEKDLLTENVLLRLIFYENADSIPRMNIFRNEISIFTIDNVRVYQNGSGAEIRLLLPSAKLEKGVYRVEFEIEKRKTSYNFSIQ